MNCFFKSNIGWENVNHSIKSRQVKQLIFMFMANPDKGTLANSEMDSQIYEDKSTIKLCIYSCKWLNHLKVNHASLWKH